MTQFGKDGNIMEITTQTGKTWEPNSVGDKYFYRKLK